MWMPSDVIRSSLGSPVERDGFELLVPPSKRTAVRRVRPSFFDARLHRLRSFLSPRTTTSNFRHLKVISLVAAREETWDGTAQRKDGTGHGSTDGVGRLVARKLGQVGARVLVHGRDAETGARVVANIEASGGAADFLAADHSALVEVRRLADAAQATVSSDG